MLCTFCFQIWKLYTITTINPSSQCLRQERKNILPHYLFGDKTIQNCLKLYATHQYDNDLLLRQETQKRLHVLKADTTTTTTTTIIIIILIMHNSAPVLENDSHKLLWDFNIQTDHLIPARRPDLIIINKKKKRICKIDDFAVPADHRINLKEREKKDKYLDLARELKKLWNMKVTIVPIVIGALGTVTKGLLKGLEDLEIGGRVETIQTTALLRTARILRRVL